MKRFGYLGEGSANTEALHTEEAITEAITQMQIFGGIHPSGQLDEDTLKVTTTLYGLLVIIRELIIFQLMLKPRCGNKDPSHAESNAHRRSKRYIIGSHGWKKRKLTYK